MRIFSKKNPAYGTDDYYIILDPSLQGKLRRAKIEYQRFRYTLKTVSGSKISATCRYLRLLSRGREWDFHRRHNVSFE